MKSLLILILTMIIAITVNCSKKELKTENISESKTETQPEKKTNPAVEPKTKPKNKPEEKPKTELSPVEKVRLLANRIAVAELTRCEKIHQKTDPGVVLQLGDYKISLSEDKNEYCFFYEHNNPRVGFEKWLGHPMHFTVYVHKIDNKTRLVCGE